jgi:coenzyme F420-0:L-glutamate ligase/coenzyme F420-1:gamma-L-glutamate ligase
MKLEVHGLKLPEIKVGDDLSKLIVESAFEQHIEIKENDIVVVTSKVLSKSKGYVIKPRERTSKKVEKIAKTLGKPPKEVELILKLSSKVVAVVPVYEILKESTFPSYFTESPEEAKHLLESDRSFLLVQMQDGRIASDAGIDTSNVPAEYYVFTPLDPDKEAMELAKNIKSVTGKEVAVVITDTEFSITKFGSIDVAIGSYGIEPIKRKFASKDRFGKPKYGGVDIVVDEIAATAALLMGQATEGIPVVIIRGLSYKKVEDGLSKSYVPREILQKGIFLSLLYTAKYRLLNFFYSLLYGSS